MNIENSVILITGASGGIGKAASLEFDRRGAMVSMADIREKELVENAAAMRNGLAIPADISDKNQARGMIDKTIEHFGTIDVIINNAAAIVVARADEITEDEILNSIKTNVTGPMAAVNHAILHMRQKGYGHIINIGSPGFMIGVPLYGPYVCSKAAMTGWTRTIQGEWAGSGIIVSEYFPGYIKTDSPAMSRYGDVAQDTIIDPDQNFMTRFFTRPKTPEDVARHLVRLVEKPKPLVYSGFFTKIGAWVSLMPGMRMSIAKNMAAAARRRMGLSMFSDE